MIRLSQLINHRGVCSRRQADRLIAQGMVKVNGEIAYLGQKVTEQDVILISDKPLRDNASKPWFILYHKPVGVVCTNALSVPNNLVHALQTAGFQCDEHWLAIGRLDKDSEGALLLTNQSQAAHALLHYQAQKSKEYIVTVNRSIDRDDIAALSGGIELDGQTTLPCEVYRLAPQIIMFRLVEGRHRQIRRMCQAIGCRVLRLQRVTFAGISLAGLSTGNYRKLEPQEVLQLTRLMGVNHESKA